MPARMILSGIPLEESYLQSRLDFLSLLERKGIKNGKIPIDDCYYLMGTADPTGKLGPNEVCVILLVMEILFCFFLVFECVFFCYASVILCYHIR